MPGQPAVRSRRDPARRAPPQAVLAEVTEGWRCGTTPVIMAGMVGSNVGWQNVPYLPLPVAFSDIGQRLTEVADGVWIVPGLSVCGDDNHNVMRGEETQLLGARQIQPSSLYVMPGTHCNGCRPTTGRYSIFIL